MKITGQEAANAICENHNDWEPLFDTREVIDTNRWSIISEMVCYHLPTDKHYMFKFSEGATEYQDEQAYEHEQEDIITLTEVKLKEVTVKKWVIVRDF